MLENLNTQNVISDSVDPSKKLHPRHSFTVQWLLSSLRENDETYQTLHGSKPVKDITASDVSEGKGFVSIVLRCIVTFVNSSDSYTTILKIPGFDSFVKAAQQQSNNDEKVVTVTIKETFARFHQAECLFYNELANILQPPIPKVFKTEAWILDEKEGCLHMEDLTKSGKILEYFDNLNMAKIKDFVGHLARMHKNILTTDPKIWKGKYLIGQKAMVDYLDFLPARCESFLENCKRIDQFKPIFDKYSKFMINRDYYLYVEKQAYIDLGLLPIIVHGDAYGGNVMYAIDKDGKVCDKISALIDWQLMHEGSPMEDLARFLVQCCDGILRRKAETFIFEYYLECLEKEFGDDKTKVPYTLEQLKKAYKYSFIAQAFFIPSYEIAFNATSDDASEIKEANHEFGISKAFDALQDVDQILQGELKTFFEKYNC